MLPSTPALPPTPHPASADAPAQATILAATCAPFSVIATTAVAVLAPTLFSTTPLPLSWSPSLPLFVTPPIPLSRSPSLPLSVMPPLPLSRSPIHLRMLKFPSASSPFFLEDDSDQEEEEVIDLNIVPTRTSRGHEHDRLAGHGRGHAAHHEQWREHGESSGYDTTATPAAAPDADTSLAILPDLATGMEVTMDSGANMASLATPAPRRH